MKNKHGFKMAAILSMILVMATLLLFALPAICYAEGYGGPAGGGGGGLPAGYTSLLDKTSVSGVFAQTTTVASEDNKCQLLIEEGTKALNYAGGRLTSILISEITPPAQPTGAGIVGLAYSLTPNGATFAPPITLTFQYNPANIPEGVNENDLVLAVWDGSNWVNLEGPFTIDPVNHTVSAPISHFSNYAIIAHTLPAAFTASNIAISPATVNTGEAVTISANITNTGDLSGTNDVVFMMNNSIVATQTITLAGHTSQVVTFSTTPDTAGTQQVSISGVSGQFIVNEVAPPPTTPPPTTPPPTTPPPTTPPPTTPPPTTPPPTTPPPTTTPTPTPTSTNWWLIGGIIIVVIIIAVVVWLLTARRRN